MQTLKEKLKEDLKIALKTGNATKKALIQVALSEVATEEKNRSASFLLDDEGVLAILRKMRKSQETTKKECEEAGREVPESVNDEIAILNTYLPQQMSEEQIRMLVSDIIQDLESPTMKDMGKVMAKFNAEFPGKADNKIVSQIVKEKLSGQN